MVANRNYSSVARLASIAAAITSSATSITVDTTSGFPSVPFTLVLDPGRTAEEAVTVTSIIGTALTILRGQDGTSAQPHDAGAQARHMATARDFREPAEHIGLTSGVHGVSGFLVGSTDSAIMDNKTFQPVGTDHVPIVVQAAAGQSSHLQDWKDSGGQVLAAIANTGRMSAKGFDSSSSSTFVAGSASTVPVIIQAAVGQTANLLSLRNSSGTEVFGVSSAGLGGQTATSYTASGSISAGTSLSANSLAVNGGGSNLSSTNNNVAAMAAKVPSGGQVPGLVVADNESGGLRAGVMGANNSYQMFHGGSTSNRVPFKMVGGSLVVQMLSGATSQGATIDYSAYGFSLTPLVYLTVRQDNVSTVQRRVAANVENIPGLTTCDIRLIQTSNEVMPNDTGYRVYWMAIQFLPNSATSIPV